MAKPKPKATPKPVKGDVASLIAAIGHAVDIPGLQKGVAAVAKLKTPEAYRALLRLAFDPPTLPFPNGLPAIIVMRLGTLSKDPAVRELLVAECQHSTEAHPWPMAIVILGDIAFAEKRGAVKDRRLCAALRRAIAFDDKNLSRNSIYVLAGVGDDESLPAIVARLDRCYDDEDYLYRIAEAMVALKGATAADLAKLKAARDRLVRDPQRKAQSTQILDACVAKLEKRLA